MNLHSSAFWFLNPTYTDSVGQRMALAHETIEINAKRPAHDYYGDEIAQMRMEGRIAVVPVNGPLLKGATGSDKKAGFASYEDIRDDIEAGISAGASAVVLDISSPGGTAVGAGELGRFIKDTVDSGTPVFSFTESMQCSAAEYLSGACSARFATADAIVGSIGTIMATLSFQGMLERNGIKAEVFTSGKFKGAGHPFKDLSDEQKQNIQGFVDELAGEFKSWMGQHRPNLKAESMEGQVFTGRQGVENGLIDATSSGLRPLLAMLNSQIG